MYIHYKSNMLTIDWTIYRGVSKTKEDFSRAKLAAFIFNKHNKIFVNASEYQGTLTLQVPAELPVGTYSIMAVWTKNHERSLQRAIADNVFAVTEFPDDATYHGGAPMQEPLKVKSSAGTFGYDGLSAYELAVLKGMTVKSENEWTKAAVDTAEAEEARKANETQRQEAETSRVNAETQRTSAEQGRASTFQQLVATMETAIGQNLDNLEQTATSTESGGTNIITATFGNGQTQTFHVRNGLQGNQGPQGEPGPQGPQGNSGYSGAAEDLEVVNNLTDGGTTAALSAEMGKTLNTSLNSAFKHYNYIPCYDLSHPVLYSKTPVVDSEKERRNGLDPYVAGTITRGTDMTSAGATHYMTFNLQGGQGGTSANYTRIAVLYPSQFRPRFFAQKKLRIIFDCKTNSASAVNAKVTIWLQGYTADAGSTTKRNTKSEVQVSLQPDVVNHIDVTLPDMSTYGSTVLDMDRLVDATLYIYTSSSTDVDVMLCNLIVTDEIDGCVDSQIRLRTENPYEGKRIIYIGDSYSTGNWYWDSFLDNLYGLADIKRYLSATPADNRKPAIAGATVACDANGMTVNASHSPYSIWYKCAEGRMSDFDFDMINLFGGINDNYIGNGYPLGSVNDKPYVDDASSFATPSNYVDTWAATLSFAQYYMGCIEMLKRDFPGKEIILCTLMPTTTNLTVDADTGMSAGESKSALIVRIAKKYDLKVVPWYWSILNENVYTIESFMRTGLHPEKYTARLMAARYAEILGL